MNGNGRDEEDVRMEGCTEKIVYTWGYLPGAMPEKSPILVPTNVRLPRTSFDGDSWKDVCGGGCGFAMAISEKGKLITWGSTDDEGQSYLTSGKHGETPESFPLPTDASVVNAAAGWAHCVVATENGEVYSWGWKECVPSGKFLTGLVPGGSLQKEIAGKQNFSSTEQESPKSQGSNTSCEGISNQEIKQTGEEVVKRRKISSSKQESDGSSPGDELFTVSPTLVTLGVAVRITCVAAGGRHSLALSDAGQVWGWGYGGEGQLGLGSRVRTVSSPHLIPCFEPSSEKDRTSMVHQGGSGGATQGSKVPGSHVKKIACGGRHSAVITDAGALLTFGWGMYGQCGLGNTSDQLRPTCVPSLTGMQVERVAAGLWHTVCITIEGHVYSFGGNQFGQLGTGAEQPETSPRLLEASCLDNRHASRVSCGARHSAVLTEDGQLFTWGWNKYGQLGLGDTIDRNIPSQVSINGCFPHNVACGWWHTLLLADSDG